MTDLDQPPAAPTFHPTPLEARASLPTALDRGAGASAALFTVCVLAGNALTESVVGTDDSPAGTAADLAAQAASTAVHVGLALEVVGLLLVGLFAGAVTALGFRTASARTPAVLASVAAAVLVAVKLGSGAPYLAALDARNDLSDDVLHALVETNGAAFLLSWLPVAVLVTATALVLRRTAVAGRLLTGTGLALGGLGLVAALLGLGDPGSAMPVPFLLSLLWLAAAGIRMAVRR
jgi:predicted metal-binding membrane protein